MTSARRDAGRPIIRRDADGRARTAPDWETLTERLIREAQDEGRFDDLPGRGRPLRLDDDTYAGDMALAHHLLRNAGGAPPWIEADKEVRAHGAAIEALIARAGNAPPSAVRRLEFELESLVDAHDGAIARLEGQAPTPRQHRSRLDREALRTRLRSASRRQDAT